MDESPPQQKKERIRDFLKWYFHVDFKDLTNYIAFLLAVFLLWWGIKNILQALSLKGGP